MSLARVTLAYETKGWVIGFTSVLLGTAMSCECEPAGPEVFSARPAPNVLRPAPKVLTKDSAQAEICPKTRGRWDGGPRPGSNGLELAGAPDRPRRVLSAQ